MSVSEASQNCLNQGRSRSDNPTDGLTTELDLKTNILKEGQLTERAADGRFEQQTDGSTIGQIKLPYNWHRLITYVPTYGQTDTHHLESLLAF